MYEDQTYEVILERMLARVNEKFDKREGAVIFDTHSPTAIEFQILYIELDTILREAYGDTASREFLILRCKERGITPDPATNAILRGVFTPSNIDVIGISCTKLNISNQPYCRSAIRLTCHIGSNAAVFEQEVFSSCYRYKLQSYPNTPDKLRRPPSYSFRPQEG